MACACAPSHDTNGVLTFVGAGGDYVQQTSYKYVGQGAGNFDVVPVPANIRPNICMCIIPLLLLLLLVPLVLYFLSLSGGEVPEVLNTGCQGMAPPGPLGQPRDCTVYGDPHVNTFDGKHADYYTPGEYWIIKSDFVKMQGKYQPTPITNGLAVTKAIAISGDIIKGHKLLIGTLDQGPAAFTWDGQPILTGFPSDYTDPDNCVTIHYNNMGSTMQKQRVGKPLHVLHIVLPLGMMIQVNEWNEPSEGAYLNAKITMPQGLAPGGDGHCGNFNGNPADDARLMVRARVGSQGVDVADLLFPGGKTPINPMNRPDINDCNQDKLEQAKATCKKTEKRWNPSMGCLVDVCFGGGGFAQEDIQ